MLTPPTPSDSHPFRHAPVPVVAGRYRIGERLGVGGVGVVYEAQDLHTGRNVALKLLPQPGSKRSKQRFLRELRTTGRIKHRNVVTALDAGELPSGAVYLVMERLVGSTFADLVQVNPLRIPTGYQVLEDAIRAIAAVHRAGYVHRDIKPTNLFLHCDGARRVVKLLDFGLSKPIADEERLTADGTLVGTPTYMAPEQILDEPVSARTDIYGFGVTAFRLLSGETPYGDPAVSDAENFARVLHNEPTALGKLRRGISPAVESVVHRCLEKNPRARFADGVALLAAWASVGPELRC